MDHQEHIIQCQCVEWFRRQHPRKLIFAIPNGGSNFDIRHAVRLKKEGLTSGVPDLFIPEPSGDYRRPLFRGLFIEMKSPTGKVSKSQRNIGNDLKLRGYAVEVCRSLGEFMSTVKNYL